jgi:hypothetical protein
MKLSVALRAIGRAAVKGQLAAVDWHRSTFMTYNLSEHRHRFAVWAAARAAQRNFTTVEKLRGALESTDIRASLADAVTYQASPLDFEHMHRRWCRGIVDHLTSHSVQQAAYGRAAKLIAVYLKATVIMGDRCDTPLGRCLHPPIDRVLLQTLAKSTSVQSPHRKDWGSISWTKLDEQAYYRLIVQLRAVLPSDTAFWQIEEYWQPSESGDA